MRVTSCPLLLKTRVRYKWVSWSRVLLYSHELQVGIWMIFVMSCNVKTTSWVFIFMDCSWVETAILTNFTSCCKCKLLQIWHCRLFWELKFLKKISFFSQYHRSLLISTNYAREKKLINKLVCNLRGFLMVSLEHVA